MEIEVRAVGGIENCFVSLPLHLIQRLDVGRSGSDFGYVPQILVLQLRSISSDGRWMVAWSGATSSSMAIETLLFRELHSVVELPGKLSRKRRVPSIYPHDQRFIDSLVAHQFADCISLPNHVTVHVRAIANVPKATLVVIEPLTEDDWEVLELNAELAEAAILNQIRIVHESMRFPLWLHGRKIITFLVVSTEPNNAVVQLVPGTEVEVAPKRRNKMLDSNEGLPTPKEHSLKSLLRIQDLDRRLIHKCNFQDFELGVVLTSVAFIHPETAKNFSLNSLQLVSILPRLSLKEEMYPEINALKTWNSSTSKQTNGRDINDQRGSHQAIVRLLTSELVAKGHLMIANSLRLYLRISLHSWVYLSEDNITLKSDFSSACLSPCHFKMLEKENPTAKNGQQGPNSQKNSKTKSKLSKTTTGTFINVVDWSPHDEVVTSLYDESHKKEEMGTFHPSAKEKGLCNLLSVWFAAQLDAIASKVGMEVNSLVLGRQTILHFVIKNCKFGTQMKPEASSDGSSDNINKTVEILYTFTISYNSLNGENSDAYELSFDERKKSNVNMEALDWFSKLSFGDPFSFHSVKEMTPDVDGTLNISSLSWMGGIVSDVINRLMVLLSPTAGRWFSSHNFRLPGHVLICGPPGSGKTLLARTLAKFLSEHDDLLTHTVYICCSRIALEKASSVRKLLLSYVTEALDHAPSVVIFDDLDNIISAPSELEGSQMSASVVELTGFLVDILDEYGEKRNSACGIGPIAFIASVQDLDRIPPSLSSSGRFDFHVRLSSPAASERGAMLKHEMARRSLICSDEILDEVATKCDGYDAYDLEILVDRAVHAAVARYLPSKLDFSLQEKPILLKDDFSRAMQEFIPVSMRDITKEAAKGGRIGWDDVGGLSDIKNSIKEMIELPSKFSNIFAQAPLRLRSNVLLYGPPGCGKTHIVGAAAAACSLRFISVKGPELLNKYIGASEQAVRDIFSKAAAAAPCLLFFDEFDSIAPKRGHDNTGVTDRVVNQFLTELDGVEVLTGVFVFAATSRPDLLDAALLRPGRLDRLLFCDFPTPRERLDILTVLSKKLPLASDVDLDAIACMTEGFSGADLQALLSDAQLGAVHELLSEANITTSTKKPIITDSLLKSTASKAKPSVSETEKQRLYSIYSQFLDSKKSVSAQSRDSKGKRATLA